MMKKNIDLERRSVDERNSDHFQELQKILDHSMLNSEGWKSILGDVLYEIMDRKDFKNSYNRKSDLSNLQSKIPPFGGLTTKPVNYFKNIYVSPGPIYDPGGRDDFGECPEQ